jgi:enoyl-CoA hydratase
MVSTRKRISQGAHMNEPAGKDNASNAEPGAAQVIYEIVDRVAYVTINRPEARNAINPTVRRGLIEAFADASVNPDVWVVVLTGTGDRAFCAGGDLKQNDANARAGKRHVVPMTGPERNVFETILETYKPTIAALNGLAYGGGLELAIACDIRIAADHAKLCLPEAKRGMGANFASVLLPRLIPRALAMQMLYTAEPITVQQAQSWGLVNMVVPGAELKQTVDSFARKLVGNAPVTLQRYKHMAVKGWDLPIPTALRLDAGTNPYLSEDRKEGVRAFVEKREPKWTGR